MRRARPIHQAARRGGRSTGKPSWTGRSSTCSTS